MIEISPPTRVAWRTHEYEHADREPSWYLGVGSAALLLFIFAVWQGNFFFATFIVIAAALIVFLGRRPPRLVDIMVDEKGVTVADLSLPYASLVAFSFRKRPGRLDELIVRRNRAWAPLVRMFIPDREVPRAREIMARHIPEVEHDESIIEIFADWMNF